MDDMQNSSPLPTFEQFQQLVREANTGTAGSLQRLRACIREHPEIYQAVGDLGRLAIEQLIVIAAGGDVAIEESLRCSVDAMRQELLGDAPTSIERIAVDRVIVAHLEANYLLTRQPTPGEASPSYSANISKLRDAAERRLQTATKSLLTLRSMIHHNRSLQPDRFKVVG